MENKLDSTQLDHVSGGQYDEDAEYIDTHAVSNGNLYNIRNMREVIGSITAGQAVQLHPDFIEMRDGVFLCIVRIDGTDYLTERSNISM